MARPQDIWHQHREPVAGHLLLPIPEDLLDGLVDKENRAVFIDRDDDIGRRLRQRLIAAFGLWEVFLRLLAHGHLTQREPGVGEAPVITLCMSVE